MLNLIALLQIYILGLFITPKRSTSLCKLCDENIPVGAVRIKDRTSSIEEPYHLKCYTPKIKQYICKSKVSILLDPAKAEIVNNWIDDWKKDYLPLDIPFREPPHFLKLVESTPSRYKRAWLEIFKFLDAIEVFKIYSYVNKEFYHISWDQELWYFLLLRDYQNTAKIDPQNNYRIQYAILYMQSCFWCHTFQTEESFERCPLIKKPICNDCKQLERFDLLSKQDIKEKYGINPNILDLKFGDRCSGSNLVYDYMAEEAVEIFIKRNIEFILEFMKKNNSDPAFIEFIEKITPKNIDDVDPAFKSDINLDESFMPIYELMFVYIRFGKCEKRVLSKLLKQNICMQ